MVSVCGLFDFSARLFLAPMYVRMRVRAVTATHCVGLSAVYCPPIYSPGAARTASPNASSSSSSSSSSTTTGGGGFKSAECAALEAGLLGRALFYRHNRYFRFGWN
jgi:hypothetical protein